ncbi:MAG: ACP S-malonyltransferase [Cyanobacteria bacterium SBLK]|nr:ACP S-malonyltransferase [Cyanobacteria bacterium SBLK]
MEFENKFLIDHNIEGQALILFGAIANQGWLDLIQIQFVFFEEIALPIESSDRGVWQFAQSNRMLLLTANRSMEGDDSLEQVMREENTPTSLPIVTISNSNRVLIDPNYREKCVESLLEIALDLNNYLGVGGIFIP